MAIREIVYPTDFSDSALQAGRLASLLAHTFKASLHVLYVPFVFPPASGCYTDYIELQKAARLKWEGKLNEFCEEIGFRGLSIKTTMGGLIIKAEILKAASRSDLIVMGRRAKAGIFRAMFGSVTERVIEAVECPILVVKNPAVKVNLRGEVPDDGLIMSRGASPFQNILVPIDDSDVPEFVLRMVKEIARPFQATITLLYLIPHKVFVERPIDNMKRAQAERHLQAMRRSLEAESFVLRTLVRPGDSAAEILDYAAEADADLIAMGTGDRRSLSHGLLEKIAKRVVCGSEIPVLLCPILAVR